MDKSLKLRFRFYNVTNKSIDIIKKEFEDLKTTIEPDFKIKIIDNHIWLSIGVLKREKHSPQLHLELEEMEDGNTAITGLYGPDPVLWTFFMFLHFIIAGVFIIFSIIAYSKWKLNQKFILDITIMTSMIILWIFLYFFARLNRKKGIPQMEKLKVLMEKVITP
ncbi:hypothetical protein SY27_04405 [Flavobacterium sp. 316]|uniref:hypothetical protein n=1 Tax=Flavobacterium sp. 316 TaxID=1603293 RepID=UPI0005E248F4|nr:hypothetical protein [Flavobacterium sp. 316]KIX21930.1 hypothetical protein SY27_04405 [Flavobacterium sp. 316]